MQELPDDEDPLRPDDEDLIGSTETRRRCGGISSMTEWRWRHSKTVGFPPPDFIIDGRNYWHKRTIRRFLARHANNKLRRRADDRQTISTKETGASQ